MPFVYSDRYQVELGQHIFPIEKYHLVRTALTLEQIPDREFFTPNEAAHADLLLVHSPAYLDDLDACRWTQRTMHSEIPLTQPIVNMFKLAAGGTMLAVDLALEQGWAVHIGGGFHHAFAAKAEGFCYINDLAVAVQKFRHAHPGQNVLIVDLDLHQGNGTAKIFEGERSVFTFSMHQEDIYPPKERSDLDIPLAPGTADQQYLELLQGALAQIEKKFAAALLVYQAGADPFQEDQLGQLALSETGLRQRDELVVTFAARHGLPLVVTLGGGYARQKQDTVDIHVATCLEARKYPSSA